MYKYIYNSCIGMLHANYIQFFWQFVSWFCIVSVTEAALGTSCNETADPSNCAENESCTNSICVCSDGYFDVSGKCESSKFQYTVTYQQLTSLHISTIKGMEMVCVVLEHKFEFILHSNFTNEQNICP